MKSSLVLTSICAISLSVSVLASASPAQSIQPKYTKIQLIDDHEAVNSAQDDHSSTSHEENQNHHNSMEEPKDHDQTDNSKAASEDTDPSDNPDYD